jgi:hypothetical protein
MAAGSFRRRGRAAPREISQYLVHPGPKAEKLASSRRSPFVWEFPEFRQRASEVLSVLHLRRGRALFSTVELGTLFRFESELVSDLRRHNQAGFEGLTTHTVATISHKMSGGCIRMLTRVIDLHLRMDFGTKRVVLPIHNRVPNDQSATSARFAAPRTYNLPRPLFIGLFEAGP